MEQLKTLTTEYLQQKLDEILSNIEDLNQKKKEIEEELDTRKF